MLKAASFFLFFIFLIIWRMSNTLPAPDLVRRNSRW